MGWKLVTVLNAGSTVLIAAFVAWIGCRQYRLGREKFKLDLFDKRFLVFAATRRFLTHVLKQGNVSMEQLFEYRGGIAEATFLFDDSTVDYLESIDERALRLWASTENLRSLPVGEARTKTAEEISEVLQWLTNQLPVLKTKFGPYLGFRRWT